MTESSHTLVQKVAGLLQEADGRLVFVGDCDTLAKEVLPADRRQTALALTDFAAEIATRGGEFARPAVEGIALLVVTILGDEAEARVLFQSRGMDHGYAKVTGAPSIQHVPQNTPAPKGSLPAGPGLQHRLRGRD